MNRSEKVALLAWQECLLEKAKGEFASRFVFDQNGEVGLREKNGGEESIRYYSLNRPSLLKFLEVIEKLEAEKERENEEQQRGWMYALYSERVRSGLLNSSSYLAEDRKQLIRERRDATNRLRTDSMQRALVGLDAVVIISPSKLAYLSSRKTAAGSDTVFYRDHLGVQRLMHQIARDQRRQQIRCDLGLANMSEEEDSGTSRFVCVRDNREMFTLLEYIQQCIIENARSQDFHTDRAV